MHMLKKNWFVSLVVDTPNGMRTFRFSVVSKTLAGVKNRLKEEKSNNGDWLDVVTASAVCHETKKQYSL